MKLKYLTRVLSTTILLASHQASSTADGSVGSVTGDATVGDDTTFSGASGSGLNTEPNVVASSASSDASASLSSSWSSDSSLGGDADTTINTKPPSFSSWPVDEDGIEIPVIEIPHHADTSSSAQTDQDSTEPVLHSGNSSSSSSSGDTSIEFPVSKSPSKTDGSSGHTLTEPPSSSGENSSDTIGQDTDEDVAPWPSDEDGLEEPITELPWSEIT